MSLSFDKAFGNTFLGLFSSISYGNSVLVWGATASVSLLVKVNELFLLAVEAG